MTWSPAMRESRRIRTAQQDLLDAPALSYKLVCDGNTPLTNRMVIARKSHECNLCDGGIQKGERIRAESRRSGDGKSILTRRVCPQCCEATGKEVEAHWAQVAARKAAKP